MSKKLTAKASLIQLPPLVPGTVGHASNVSTERGEAAHVSPSLQGRASERRVKTAPGSMAAFMVAQSAAINEAEELRDRLKELEGSQPAKPLDPKQVRPSRWANRHAESMGDAAFVTLRDDIASAAGNVQPICVRPAGRNDVGPMYEVVYGHRRHKACLDLGLPVMAVIMEMSDQQLFEAMDRENRARKNLSPWEQGMTYRRALEQGLYPSQRKLAEALGVDLALVSKSLRLASLPDVIVDAFPSPLDIQFRWAQPLAEAMQRDPESVLKRAKSIGVLKPSLNAKQVLTAILHGTEEVLNGSTPAREQRLGRPGGGVMIRRDPNGQCLVKFDANVLTEAKEEELVAWIKKVLNQAA